MKQRLARLLPSPALPSAARLAAGLAAALALVATPATGSEPAAAATVAGALATTTATRQALESTYVADGVVEAVRRVVVSAQVAGRITRLEVRAGDRVTKGQVLARIDERTAVQQANASGAQVAAANAALEAARKELERTERLYRKQYISQAAMDRAQAQYDAAAAQARATVAQAGAATTATALHTVVAPFSGLVSRAMVEQGDMAMPDKPLLEVFDPTELRITASVPESVATTIRASEPVAVQLSGVASAAPRALTAPRAVLMPTADAASHSFEVRIPLPADAAAGVSPGQFARITLQLAAPAAGGTPGSAAPPAGRLTVPVGALVRRTEFAGVYVVGTDGKPQLRQVRPGRTQGDRVEILAGLSEGERVALDPAAAARLR